MLSDYQTLVAKAVWDDNNIVTTDDIIRAIALAVIRYSQDRPRTAVIDIAANGLAVFTLPTDWEFCFSNVLAIEYPIGARPLAFLESDRYQVYQSPTSQEELLFMFVPSFDFRLTYTVSHLLSSTVDTIPAKHQEAVMCWAAAICCEQLASYYAQASDNTISADHVQRNSQSKDYAFAAKTFRERYFAEVGVEEKKLAAASATVDLDLLNSWNQDRFIHSNRFR